jgi:hypothetical protein
VRDIEKGEVQETREPISDCMLTLFYTATALADERARHEAHIQLGHRRFRSRQPTSFALHSRKFHPNGKPTHPRVTYHASDV